MSPARFQPGACRLVRSGPRALPRRVALLSHQAAVDGEGATTAERLHARLGHRLRALLGPEHGYFGSAPAGAHGTSVPTSALNSVVRGGPPHAL